MREEEKKGFTIQHYNTLFLCKKLSEQLYMQQRFLYTQLHLVQIKEEIIWKIPLEMY